MVTSKRVLSLTLLATLPFVAACGGDGTSPRPSGALQASIVSPNGPEGAALLELVGPVTGLSAPGADTLLTRTRGDTARVFAAWRTPGAMTFLFESEDPVSGRILEVAGARNQLRELAGYRLEISSR